jgi:hypothetical protein
VTGEGVEAIIVMLVVVLAIFKMVKRPGSGLGQTYIRDESEKKETGDNG